MFGFGDLEILTAADTGVDRFQMIRNPIGFKKAMLDAKHEYERDVAGSGTYAPSPPLRSEPVAAPAPIAGAVPVGDETVSGSVPGRPGPATLSSDELTRTLVDPGRPARPRRDQRRGVRAQEGGPPQPALGGWRGPGSGPDRPRRYDTQHS